jgi:hypothetical protein
MEIAIVLIAAIHLFAALVLVLRRYGRLVPRGAQQSENAQRAESWLTKGSRPG